MSEKNSPRSIAQDTYQPGAVEKVYRPAGKLPSNLQPPHVGTAAVKPSTSQNGSNTTSPKSKV